MAHIPHRRVESCRVDVSYDGARAAVEALEKALKARETKAVQKALDYVKKHPGEQDGGTFRIEATPDPFVALSRDFPNVEFIFDFEYYGELTGWDGRYYCVYRGGKKVYDADGVLDHDAYLNAWLDERGLEGDFYAADREEQKALIARGRLVEQGKKPLDITDEDVAACIDGFDEDLLSAIEGGDPCNFAEFLLEGKDYNYYRRCLNDGEIGDSGFGWEDYLEHKKEGDLPSFNATHTDIFSYDEEA